ncbi:DUF2092 domain-containing protein [Caulobacter sp. 17J65-9]|uniref:DUF2092 domain-containing protein n=1 Tax=Caulobacter sp. 17J65-9 TaxID=2709382 RepID=UPI0013C822FC|nr:DUF2092 domain-containing protein [Caulobacter sp. 17J65-9]NEX93748.1 DUF2092 domain-containing protein [Caulobacter sp. 17J65-9]
MPRTTAVQMDLATARRLLAAAAGATAVVLALPAPAPAQTPASMPTQTPPAVQSAVQKPVAAPAQAAPAQAPPAVDPKVIDAMNKMGAFLRDQKVFELTARTTNDVVLDDDTVVKFDGVNTYKAKRPDALFVDVDTDRKRRQFFYDGKTLTIYAPRQKYYAQVAAPGTIHELLDKLEDDLGVDMPLDDLFYWGTPDSGLNELTAAQYIGYARVDGHDTDQFAFSQPGLDWQLWIDRGEQPLPRKLVIIHTDQDERPQYEARLDWRLRPNFTADAFTFSPPADAKPIQIVSLGALQQEGTAP